MRGNITTAPIASATTSCKNTPFSPPLPSPRLGLDEPQQVFLVHPRRVVDVGVDLADVVEVTMRGHALGLELLLRVEHQVKVELLLQEQQPVRWGGGVRSWLPHLLPTPCAHQPSHLLPTPLASPLNTNPPRPMYTSHITHHPSVTHPPTHHATRMTHRWWQKVLTGPLDVIFSSAWKSVKNSRGSAGGANKRLACGGGGAAVAVRGWAVTACVVRAGRKGVRGTSTAIVYSQ